MEGLMDDIVDGIPSDACGSDEEVDDVESPESVHSLPLEFGMEFDSDEHAISYYRKYAGSIGFNIRKEYVNRNKAGIITSRKLTCCREGFRGKDRRDAFVKNPRKDTRTGCLAHIVISRDQSSGKYRVTSFEAEHNHPLAPKGTEHMLPSKRKTKKVRGDTIDFADDFGIQPSQSKIKKGQAHEFMDLQACGRAYCIDKDQRNYLRTKRQRDMKLGDAGNLLRYFEKRRLEDPSFFFAIQLDVNDLITNVFWADAKMIVDHKLFGDVLSLDSTYITNINYRPFALFVGMNHYKKMVIFGAALMYDETIESFRWLFETFLKAMSGRKPKTILTAQCAAISKAVSLVMPEAYHRLCVWHMERDAIKHLNQVFNGSDSFAKDFYKCIYEVEGEEEFLSAWEAMLDKYDLRDNDWLKGIFALREKWAMVYGRNVFSGGMRSTKLSESFNDALEEYLKSDMGLVQLLNHFERAIDDKRYKELEASGDMTQRPPRLNVELPLLIHARDVYTSVIFEMFQDEWAKSLLVIVNSHMEDGLHHIYKVSTVSHTQEHTVIAKSTDVMASCSCKKFEYVGILCSHALKILDMMNVKLMIPSHYILKRWTKDARVGSVEVVNGGDTEEDPVSKVANRYRNLCPAFVQIAARASESKAAYELAARYANELAAKLEAIIKAENSSEASATPSTALEGLDIGNHQLSMVENAKVPAVTGATWQSLVMECDFPVLVEFWASWSGPCGTIHPIVTKLSKVYESRLKCFKLDTDESPEIAAQFGIRSIPAIIFFKNGEKKDTLVGVVSEGDLVEWIEKFLGAVSWFSLFRN